ncbi:unnamed protein product [Ambrosiozyma monospora]|uniref:Unnamed protein product n=1 Tax=Ambrosiozyma monospora TaxID=43982 RepID=A0A9W6YLG3_AMBMO|nr:unnamed protein product [Ambrosiozyma monospora]
MDTVETVTRGLPSEITYNILQNVLVKYMNDWGKLSIKRMLKLVDLSDSHVDYILKLATDGSTLNLTHVKLTSHDALKKFLNYVISNNLTFKKIIFQRFSIDDIPRPYVDVVEKFLSYGSDSVQLISNPLAAESEESRVPDSSPIFDCFTEFHSFGPNEAILRLKNLRKLSVHVIGMNQFSQCMSMASVWASNNMGHPNCRLQLMVEYWSASSQESPSEPLNFEFIQYIDFQLRLMIQSEELQNFEMFTPNIADINLHSEVSDKEIKFLNRISNNNGVSIKVSGPMEKSKLSVQLSNPFINELILYNSYIPFSSHSPRLKVLSLNSLSLSSLWLDCLTKLEVVLLNQVSLSSNTITLPESLLRLMINGDPEKHVVFPEIENVEKLHCLSTVTIKPGTNQIPEKTTWKTIENLQKFIGSLPPSTAYFEINLHVKPLFLDDQISNVTHLSLAPLCKVPDVNIHLSFTNFSFDLSAIPPTTSVLWLKADSYNLCHTLPTNKLTRLSISFAKQGVAAFFEFWKKNMPLLENLDTFEVTLPKCGINLTERIKYPSNLRVFSMNLQCTGGLYFSPKSPTIFLHGFPETLERFDIQAINKQTSCDNCRARLWVVAVDVSAAELKQKISNISGNCIFSTIEQHEEEIKKLFGQY